MAAKPKIVIIGGGVAGLSVAMRAAELGGEVTVLEQRHLAAGSSGLSAGLYSVNQVDRHMLEVRVAARKLIDRFVVENDMHVSRIGYMRLGKTESHLGLFREGVAIQHELGLEQPSRVLDPEEIADLVPHLRLDDLAGAMFNPGDGHIDGPLLCSVLADRARAHGAQILAKSRIIKVGRGQRHRHLVKSMDGDYEADIVVNAAGPWAAHVGEMLGHDFAVVNQRHEVILVKQPTTIDYVVPMVQEYVPGGDEGVYFRQDGPDSMLAGFHSHDLLERLESEDPDNYSASVDWETVERVAGRVADRLPVEGLGFKEGWCGLYPMSADGRYIVGPYSADETVFAVGGFGGAGLASSLSLGSAAAEWMLGGEPQTVPSAVELVPDRPSLADTAFTVNDAIGVTTSSEDFSK